MISQQTAEPPPTTAHRWCRQEISQTAAVLGAADEDECVLTNMHSEHVSSGQHWKSRQSSSVSRSCPAAAADTAAFDQLLCVCECVSLYRAACASLHTCTAAATDASLAHVVVSTAATPPVLHSRCVGELAAVCVEPSLAPQLQLASVLNILTEGHTTQQHQQQQQ